MPSPRPVLTLPAALAATLVLAACATSSDSISESRPPLARSDEPDAAKSQWVAVYETPPGTRYGEQRVIYLDRTSVQPQPLENLTYYLGRTREVSPGSAKARIQELAVLCEGTPIAPATSLRGEGTEESAGNYSMKRAPVALTSVSQFSTQRIRRDSNNPNTFIVRAICLLGTEGGR